jgi:hypothetical protein
LRPCWTLRITTTATATAATATATATATTTTSTTTTVGPFHQIEEKGKYFHLKSRDPQGLPMSKKM